MQLRPYQQEAYDCTLAVFEKTDAALCVMATGLGKTIFFAHIANHFLKTGRVMVLAHRAELIYQAQDKMKIITAIEADVEKGDEWATQSKWVQSEIVVSTIQTQVAGRDGGRMNRFDPNEFSLLVIDEAHHAPAETYKRVIDYYTKNPNLKVLGVTATPDRTDKKAMGQIFNEVAYSYDIEDGIEDGWLVPVEIHSKFLDYLDYSEVGTIAGELNGKDLANVLENEEVPHGFVDGIMEYAGDKKTLVFAATVAQAEMMTEIFNRPSRKPGSARLVTGKTPTEIRSQTFSDFTKSKFQYLVNVGVATEGFDEPTIECIALARPTKSRSLFTQMLGRGTRTLVGIVDGIDDAIERREAIAGSKKPSILVIDFVGNSGKHKLISPADILGGKYADDVIELAKENAAATGKPANVATELQQAEREIAKRAADREEAAFRDQIKLRAHFSTAKVNPFEVLDINPTRETSWHKGKMPSQKQLDFLHKKGVDTDGMTLTHAKQMIDTLFKRQKTGKATFKQTKLLQKKGIDTANITFEKAGKMISQLANNRWQAPISWKKLDCWVGKRA